MALPIFFTTIEQTIDDTQPNLSVVKLLISNKSAFGGSSIVHHILPENVGGTISASRYAGANNSSIYNTTSDVSAKMALLYNAHGNFVTPNFGQAVTNPDQVFNFIGIALSSSTKTLYNWNRIFYSPPSPVQRNSHAMAYTGMNSVLFGGSDGLQFFGDTWEWDGHTWAEKFGFIGVLPQARKHHAMVYDGYRNTVLLYGGINSSNTYLSDTRPYEAGTWFEFAGILNPGGRAHHSMAFDSKRNVSVMFGGFNGTISLNDTWETDALSWTQVFPTNSPSARYDFGMAFDASRNKTVLFGGTNGTSTYNDVWEYDGITWKQIAISGPSPSERSQVVMIYDADRKKIFLFGGFDGNNKFFNDTWSYDGTGWTNENVVGPPARSKYAMNYDIQRSKIVLFGGTNIVSDIASGTSDLWEFGSPLRPVSVQTSGDGYVYYDASSGSSTPVIGDFLGPSSVIGATTPLYDGYSPVFGVAVEGPVIDPNNAPNPLEINLNGNMVGIIKMRIRPFYGFIPPLPPSITNFTPSSGIVGDRIVLNGSVFIGTSQLTINNVDGYSANATFDVISNNQLSFIIPAGAQKGTITVTNAQGNSTSSSQFVTLPTITSINAVANSVGSAITIYGHTFTYATNITFNGTSQPSFTIVNDGEISTTIPIGATTGDIVITITYPVADNRTATYKNFNVVSVPNITSIAPLTGPIGTSAYTTLSGNINASVTTIGVVSTAGFASAGVVIIGSEQISYTGLTLTSFTGCVRGINGTTAASHTASDGVSSITINPHGYVSLTGSGFTVSGSELDGYGSVEFIDVLTMTQILPATRTVFNDTTISIIVPNPGIAQPSTAYYIRITNDGGVATSSQQFTIIPSPKFLSSASTTLNGGITPSTSTIVVVSTTGFNSSGNFFIQNEQISYTGKTLTSFTGCVRGINGTTATSHSNGTTVETKTFISQTNDAQGVAGSIVRIFGDYGFTGVSTVSFNGYLAPIVNFINDGYITAVVPSVSSSIDISGYISVSSTGGTKSTADAPTTSPITFTILQAPTITSFVNAFDSTQAGKTGDTIIITGTNLLAVSNVIFTNDAYASYTVLNNTTINAVVPSSGSGIIFAPAQGPITITKGPTSPYDFVAISSQNFLYYPPPASLAVSSPSPVNGVNGGYGTSVTLTGTNLNQGGTPTVTFGGTIASITSSFINNVVVTVPNGAGSGIVLTTAGGSTSVGFVTLQPVSISSFRTNYAPPRSRINQHVAAPQYNTQVDVYGSNFRNSPDMIIYVISGRTYSSYVVPFTFYDSTHISFLTSSLLPIAGDTCYISLTTSYPGGTYNTSVYGLELIYVYNY